MRASSFRAERVCTITLRFCSAALAMPSRPVIISSSELEPRITAIGSASPAMYNARSRWPSWRSERLSARCAIASRRRSDDPSCLTAAERERTLARWSRALRELRLEREE